MTPSVPYQLVAKAGSCQIGSVWSARDENQQPLAVAVLDAGIAADPRWRNAFAATSNALGRGEATDRRFLAADFTAPSPWVAYPEPDLPLAAQIFAALGMDYRPVDQAPADDTPAEEPAKSSGDSSPVVGWPLPSVAEEPPPAEATEPVVEQRPTATRPTLVIAAVVLLVLVGGGILFAVTRPGAGEPAPTGQPGAASPSTTVASAMPTAAALNPGLEPPTDGGWPQWPRFTATDRIRTLTGLDGLTFPVKVPLDWQCTPAGRAEGQARHLCGAPAGSGSAVGGELVVRDCPSPCDGGRQAAMRGAEEAWGLRWVRGGPSSFYAERSGLVIDGEPRYVLVVIAYFRSGEGDVDRQLVLRMSSPLENANQLRRVTNYLRDTLIF